MTRYDRQEKIEAPKRRREIMADGYESSRSDEYFSGGMKDRPAPRRIKKKEDATERPPPAGAGGTTKGSAPEE